MPTSTPKLSGRAAKNGRLSRPGAGSVPKERKTPKKSPRGHPGGDLSAFLHSELKARGMSVLQLHQKMLDAGFSKQQPQTVYSWMSRKSGPRFDDLAFIAKALGYADWFELVAAIQQYRKPTK